MIYSIANAKRRQLIAGGGDQEAGWRRVRHKWLSFDIVINAHMLLMFRASPVM